MHGGRSRGGAEEGQTEFDIVGVRGRVEDSGEGAAEIRRDGGRGSRWTCWCRGIQLDFRFGSVASSAEISAPWRWRWRWGSLVTGRRAGEHLPWSNEICHA